VGYRNERPVPIPQTSPNTGRTFFGAGASGAPAPVNHLQEGPVTEQGDAGPGYYQTRGTGNKSGRTSPKQQLRGSARDLTLAHHGLIDAGAADPNQGQLFNADKTVGPRRTDEQVIKDTGGNMPTGIDVKAGTTKDPDRINTVQYGGARGYMPNLDSGQKVKALNSVQEGRIESGTYRGGGATAEIMEDRETVRNKTGNQAWYGGVDKHGQHDMNVEGLASEAINQRAARSGVSGAAMTRAAAITSPRSAWDINKPGSPDHQMPNLDHAEGVIQGAAPQASRSWVQKPKEMTNKDGTKWTGTKIEGTTIPATPPLDRADAVQIGKEVHSAGLPTMGAKAAGIHYDNGNDVSSNIQVSSAKSLKAPNFEVSLRLSGGGDKQGSRAIQRMAAQSWTGDTHDARAAGIGGSKVLEQRVGVYDVLAMTGTRTAHRNRELGPHEQAREWVGQRGPNQAESPHQGMIMPGPTATKLNPDAVNTPPVQQSPVTSRQQRRAGRNPLAEGLDF